MPRYKVIRIHVMQAESKGQAWRWLREAKPEDLERILDFQTIKEVETDGLVRAIVRQVTGK